MDACGSFYAPVLRVVAQFLAREESDLLTKLCVCMDFLPCLLCQGMLCDEGKRESSCRTPPDL